MPAGRPFEPCHPGECQPATGACGGPWPSTGQPAQEAGHAGEAGTREGGPAGRLSCPVDGRPCPHPHSLSTAQGLRSTRGRGHLGAPPNAQPARDAKGHTQSGPWGNGPFLRRGLGNGPERGAATPRTLGAEPWDLRLHGRARAPAELQLSQGLGLGAAERAQVSPAAGEAAPTQVSDPGGRGERSRPPALEWDWALC